MYDRRVRWVCVLWLAACGRIGFDELARGDGGSGGQCPVRYLQGHCSEYDQTTGTTMLTTGFTGSLTPGSLIVVAADFSDIQQTPALNDSAGHTFHTVSPLPARSSAGSEWIWFASNTGSTMPTISIGFVQPVSAIGLDIHEYTGVDVAVPIEDYQTMTGNSLAPQSPAAATLAPGDLAFSHAQIANVMIISVTGPFTARQTCNGNMTADVTAALPTSETASYVAAGSDDWLASLTVIRAGCP